MFLIEMCHQQTYYKVRVIEETTEVFECKNSLKQEDALSTVLFHLALKKAIKNTHKNIEIELVGVNTFLAYSDDIVIL